MGIENALIAQATNAGRASRSMRLFRIGRNEVKTVAISARRAYILKPLVFSALQFILHKECKDSWQSSALAASITCVIMSSLAKHIQLNGVDEVD